MSNTAVTKNTTIDEVLKMDMDTSKYFLEIGMHCLGCPMSRRETIEQACRAHGTDADKLIENLNKHLSGK